MADLIDRDAAKLLSLHLIQCGALMPMQWLEKHGEGSETMQAFRLALDILDDKKVFSDVTDINVGDKWISVVDEMPDEHDSLFAQFYGTSKWRDGMFRKLSNEVIVGGVFEDGSKFVTSGKTHDGKWDNTIRTIPHRITHWQPLPEPPSVSEKEKE